MAKINILTPELFNKISAGEVIEKPASIVKELVENSIDAGATKVTIQVFDGGISKIIVSDNGDGISPDDLEPAFLPHATSKIACENDLYDISTLGFRGEALASIGAVSEVEIISKTEKTEGHSIKISGGKVVAKGEKGSPVGTYICVENLFFNTPARQKFLKKPKREESEITTLVIKMILANPNVAIKYIADNKQIYSSSGQGLKDAIFAIYGSQTVNNIIPINIDNGEYKISGYLGKTSFFKSNRTYQTVMINNRWVADSIVSVALGKSYDSYMMKHCFPFCVINFSLPNSQVDVNVHPSKMEVRFQDPKKVFGFIYNSVTETLYNDIISKTTKEVEIAPQLELTKPMEITRENSECEPMVKSPINTENTQNSFNDFGMNILFNDTNTSDISEVHSSKDSVLSEIIIEKFASQTVEKNNIDDVKPNYTPQPTQEKLIQQEIEDKDAYLSTQIIGKVFNTFIIMEQDENLYLIDQHAAHERLLFDKFVSQIENDEVSIQPLLLPYTIEVNHQEEQFINDNIEMLRSLGFDINAFGNLSFKISAIPSILPNLNVQNFFANFLSNLNNYTQMKSIDLIRDDLAEKACKHAVKGGDDLNKEELIKLVRGVGSGDVTQQCPHGRPFLVKFTRKDLDRWFKRTV